MLEVYAAGIEYVHDQTVRLLNARLGPDEIARRVRLPEELAKHRYLQEFYGTVHWSARGVYERYIGWFSGDPVDLNPLDPQDRARRYMAAMGGRSAVLRAAGTAIRDRQFQWALDLASIVYKTEPGNVESRRLRTLALRGLAGEQRNPLARNYYLTCAIEDNGLLPGYSARKQRVIDESPARFLFNMFKVRLIPEKVAGVNWTISFRFTDTGEQFVLRVQYSILRIVDGQAAIDYSGSYDTRVTTSLAVWKDILNGRRSAVTALASGDISVESSLWTLWNFLSAFDRK